MSMYRIRSMLLRRLALFVASLLVTIVFARFGLDQFESCAYRVDDRSEILDALDFWSRSRAYPADEIPAAGVASAHARMKTLLRKHSMETAPWLSIGPDTVSYTHLTLPTNREV